MPPTAVPAGRPRRWRLPLGALSVAVLFVGFLAGLIHLLRLRFDAGDVYPPYSTLRSDPLGAKVFFASLQSQFGLGVERSLRPTASLGVPVMSRPGQDHGEARFTCFYLGVSPDEWPYLFDHATADRLEDIATRGGRVVVTFLPTTHLPTVEGLDHAREMRAILDSKKEKNAARRRELSKASMEADLSKEWGIDFHRVDTGMKPFSATRLFRGGPPPSPTPVPAAAGTAADGPALARDGQALPVNNARGLPVVDDTRPVSWHTAVDFDLAAPAARQAGWHALYQRADRPVIVARSFGRAGGELILASDTYFLSNEGLHADPHPALLAALVGPGRKVLFDESHLGISENPGLMTLARRYRLQGVLAALGLLAGLFVWRNMVSLVPPRAADTRAAEDAAPVIGRDAAAGFFNLLRRGVAPRDLPALCLAQWRQNLSPTASTGEARQLATPANAARLQEVLEGDAARRSPPAALYRAMCEKLKRST